jgi:DNA-3-methyladenine glycosylase I
MGDDIPSRRGLRRATDGTIRCWWCADDPLYVAYHDHEWGIPVHDDRRLFEKLCLEGFQAGLSWLTILRKRPAFRAAFAGFDPERVARFTDADVTRLLGDAGIVRHRRKIEATITNARAYAALVEAEGPLAAFVWGFVGEPGPPPRRPEDLPTETPASRALARELRRRGWRYLGPTTIYAFMQAMGLVDDHLVGCHARGAGQQGIGR